MKKFAALFLMFISTHAMAGISIGSGKLSSMPDQHTLKFSLDELPANFIYNVSCGVESGGRGTISDVVLRFDYEANNPGMQFGGVYFDDRMLTTQQAYIDGHHLVEFRNIRTAGKGASISINFLGGMWPATVSCSAYPATGLKQ